MRRLAAGITIAVTVAGCGGGGPAEANHHGPQRTAVAGGCGTSRLYRGPVPDWAKSAFADSSSSSTPWPYTVGTRGDALAVEFAQPLRAGRPTEPANKVLWIMRLPRNGKPLKLRARPLNAAGPVVRGSWPADSSPGEIYPSYVNVPSPGCWRVSLHWAGHTDSVDLRYTG
jgi:hypothetical protein